MAAFDPKLPDRGAVLSQVVSDQLLRNKGILLQKLAHQFQRGVLISFGLDQHIEDLALSVDSPPKVDRSAVDFQIDLVELPSRMRLQAPLSQVGRDHRSEMVHPTPNRLIRASRKYLPLYVAEFEWRYNNRDNPDIFGA